MGKYDIIAEVAAKPRTTGATNNVETPAVQASTAGLAAQATAQFQTYADTNGVVRVRIGLLASGRFGIAVYNADGTLNNETNSVPA